MSAKFINATCQCTVDTDINLFTGKENLNIRYLDDDQCLQRKKKHKKTEKKFNTHTQL